MGNQQKTREMYGTYDFQNNQFRLFVIITRGKIVNI